jgi:hypothetical protein
LCGSGQLLLLVTSEFRHGGLSAIETFSGFLCQKNAPKLLKKTKKEKEEEEERYRQRKGKKC